MRQNWFENNRPPRREPSLWDELLAAFKSIHINVVSPEHFSVTSQRKRPIVVWSLIGSWVVFYLGCAIFMGAEFEGAPIVFGFVPAFFFAGFEPWRILTAMFLHGSVAHLVLNSLVFALMAPMLERTKGKLFLAVVFFVGSISGFLLHGFFYMAEKTPTIGASGGIAAVLGVYPVLYKRAVILFRVEPTGGAIPAVPLVWFWIITQLVWSVLDPQGSTSYLSHIGGFAAGFAIAYIYKRFIDKPKLRIIQ